MHYEGMIYRPPSEAYSLIVQVTVGCAHNGCTFCNMYKAKQFHLRDNKDILADLEEGSVVYGKQFDKVFFADGDALIIPTEQMLQLLTYVKANMPWVKQVSSYATPRDILLKTEEELRLINEQGLVLLYIGAESGDDEVLTKINKGVTSDEIIAACKKAKRCGFKTSVTLISGLGAQERLKEHAVESAKLISEIQPTYLGFLTLMLEEPAPIVKEVESGSFQLLTPVQVMEEMELFLTHVNSPGTIFRANHASNYLMLRGTLNQDKEMLLNQVETAKQDLTFRKESYRRL